jgi:hypothetical protein
MNSGAAPASWSTAGTILGINAPSGFTGDPIDVHINGGATVFQLTYTGTLQIGNTLQSAGVRLQSGHLSSSSTAPTIGTCGTSPSIVASNGTAAFQVNVGTGGTATTCTVNMPAATTGWICGVFPNAAPQAAAETFAVPTSTTVVTISNYTASTGAALAFASSAVYNLQCSGY